jgi:hypothetical protein
MSNEQLHSPATSNKQLAISNKHSKNVQKQETELTTGKKKELIPLSKNQLLFKV